MPRDIEKQLLREIARTHTDWGKAKDRQERARQQYDEASRDVTRLGDEMDGMASAVAALRGRNQTDHEKQKVIDEAKVVPVETGPNA